MNDCQPSTEADHVPAPSNAPQGSEGWRKLAFSNAVLLNPLVSLDRGATYPFVDMAAVDPGSRDVGASRRREYSGGGSRFCTGDTVMARITPCLENGKIARYRGSDAAEPAHGSTEFIVVRGRAEVTDSEFAYYLTRWEGVSGWAVTQMTGTSGRQRVATESLRHLVVPIPPIEEQRAIARILSTLDDKIELNRRMAATLEETVRALFKSWFVDFDPVHAKMEGRDGGLPQDIATLFPNQLAESELGKIPKGWRIGSIADVAASPRRTAKPSELPHELPYIGLEHMPRQSIALTDWGQAGKVKSGKSKFDKGNILFGKLRPYFHKVGVAPLSGVCSTDIMVIAPKKPQWAAFLLAWVSSSEFVAYANQASTGTKMPRTNWKVMSDYRLCLPPEQTVCAFQSLVQPMLDRIIANIHESRALALQRDALLPKLVSGDVQVSPSNDR